MLLDLTHGPSRTPVRSRGTPYVATGVARTRSYSPPSARGRLSITATSDQASGNAPLGFPLGRQTCRMRLRRGSLTIIPLI